MKTEQELRKMMKSKKYSGDITERDAAYIKEVEDGFKALYPDPVEFRIGFDESKIPDAIRNSRDNRLKQFISLREAVAAAKAKIADLVSLTDKVELAGSFAQISKHFLEIENLATILEVLKERVDKVAKLSDAANTAYQAAKAETHFCWKCRNLRMDRVGLLCYADKGGQSVPLEELKFCPDPSGKDFDQHAPFVRRESFEMPAHGAD